MPNQEKKLPKHSLATRILAIVLTVLVASSVVIYLVDLFVNLFSDDSTKETETVHDHDHDHLRINPEEIVLAENSLPISFSFETHSC